MSQLKPKGHIRVSAILTLLILAVDFLPSFGTPSFRYTGSDPSHHVWNPGYPIAFFIFDQSTPPYWLLGPLSVIVLFFQALLVMAVIFATRILLYVRNLFAATIDEA
jgi:hypothetical protein